MVISKQESKNVKVERADYPSYLFPTHKKEFLLRVRRGKQALCSHLSFSRRGSTWAWGCEVGFVLGDREGCEMCSWASQTIAEQHASHTVLRRGEGSGALSLQPPSRHEIYRWERVHPSLCNGGNFDQTRK